MRIKKWLALTVLALGLSLGLLASQRYLRRIDDGVSGLDLTYIFTPCENTAVASVVSPDGHFRAVVFVRDRGSQTSMSTHVSVLRSDQRLPNEPGNAFVASPVWASSLGSQGDIPLTLTWTADRQLQVGYRSQKDYHNGIDIRTRNAQVRVALSALRWEWVHVRFQESP